MNNFGISMETSISPITLSSSRSSDTSSATPLLENSPGKCDSVIIVDSSDFERMHLDWRRRNKSVKCTIPNTPVSNIQKVTDWIKSIEKSNTFNVNETVCGTDIYESDNDKNSNTLDEESKGFVVVRCDYMKPVTSQTENCIQLKRINLTKPSVNHKLKNRFQVCHNAINIPKKNKFVSVIKNSDKISFNSSVDKESYSSSVKLIDEKSDASSDLCELPKSIEIRKKELCTYLKLMDPSDKKEILALQNRRSTRVRNLAALQERIKLEKKIVENSSKKNVHVSELFHSVCLKQNEIETATTCKQTKCSNTSSKSSQNSSVTKPNMIKDEILMSQKANVIHQGEKNPAMKSYKELNIQNLDTPTASERFNQFIPEAESEILKQSFYIPFSPKNLSKIQNFDIVMKKLIPKFKMSIAKKSRSPYSSSTFQIKSFSKNKENIGCIENNLEEKKTVVKTPIVKNSINNPSKERQFKEKLVNKMKYKNKIDLFSLRNKNQKLSNGKFKTSNNKYYNVKLRSSKFKIRLKRIPTKNELFKNKKNLKGNSNNLKFEKKIKTKNLLKLPLKKEAAAYEVNKLQEKKINIISREESKIDNLLDTNSEIFQSQGQIEDRTINLQNLMVDINDFNNLTEEHKKCLIESRLLLNTTTSNYKESQLFQSQEELPPLYGFSISDVNEIKLMCEIFEQSILKHSQKPFKSHSEVNQTKEIIGNEAYSDKTVQNGIDIPVNTNTEIVCNFKDHTYISMENTDNLNSKTNEKVNYINDSSSNSVEQQPFEKQNRCLEINPNDVEENKCVILPYERNVEIKSLQKSLHFVKKKNIVSSPEVNVSQEWDLDESSRPKIKRSSHYISINKENGGILKAFYVDFNLVICQEFIVSFWMQTPLGNVLGSQDMWIPRGYTQRLVLNNKCVQKDSKEMVFSSETNVAYMELWTKEHKSDIREGPVADIFITIYFWKQRQIGIDKKVLQLENINGFADDVQYCVMKNALKIIVSWHVASEGNDPKGTFVHAYQLAADYQMVSHISDIEPIDHYVSSLHNIEGCDNLIMGCGEQKITLWNVEYGHKIATIELTDIGSELSTLWVKCDRGFLFAIQQCGNRELRLIAINGINHSWKKLASYFPSEGFDRLKGVCIENGLLLSFYDKGVLCWKAETGEPIEEIIIETDLFTCGNYLILLEENKIFVRHCTTHLLSMSVDEQ